MVTGVLKAPDPKFGGCGMSLWPGELLGRSIAPI